MEGRRARAVNKERAKQFSESEFVLISSLSFSVPSPSVCRSVDLSVDRSAGVGPGPLCPSSLELEWIMELLTNETRAQGADRNLILFRFAKSETREKKCQKNAETFFYFQFKLFTLRMFAARRFSRKNAYDFYFAKSEFRSAL